MARYSSTRSSASTTRSKSTRIEDVVTRSRTARLAAAAHHGTNLTDLPYELLLMICLYLNPTDVAKLRREHRKLAAVGIEHIVSELIINFTETSLQQLEAVSRHPIISRYVTSILWEADCLPAVDRYRWETMLESLEKIAAWRAQFIMDSAPGDAIGNTARSEALIRYLNMPQHQYTKVQLDEEWTRFRALCSDQGCLLMSPSFGDRMTTALKRFPRLKHMTMSTGHAYNNSSNRDAREYKVYGPSFSLLTNAFGLAGMCGVSPALRLLMGAYHAGIQLDTFECGSVDWKLLAQSHEVSAIMKGAVSNLKEMDLLLHLKPFGPLLPLGGAQADVDECEELLASGRLHDFITSAPHLEALSIGFDWGPFVCPADLKTTVGGFHWPHLRSVYFENVSATKDDMMDFLGRHKKTLKVLRLYDVYLKEGELLSMFRSMRSSLELEMVDFRGRFLGGNVWDFGYKEIKPSMLKLRVQDFVLGQGDITSIDDLGSQSFVL